MSQAFGDPGVQLPAAVVGPDGKICRLQGKTGLRPRFRPESAPAGPGLPSPIFPLSARMTPPNGWPSRRSVRGWLRPTLLITSRGMMRTACRLMSVVCGRLSGAGGSGLAGSRTGLQPVCPGRACPRSATRWEPTLEMTGRGHFDPHSASSRPGNDGMAVCECRDLRPLRRAP